MGAEGSRSSIPNLFPKSIVLLAKSVIPAMGVAIIVPAVIKAVRRFFNRVKLR